MGPAPPPTRRVTGSGSGWVARRPAVAAAVMFIVGVACHRLLPVWPAAWLVLLALTTAGAAAAYRFPAQCSAGLALALVVAGLLTAQLFAFYFPERHVGAFAGDDPRLARVELRFDHPPRVIAPQSDHRAMPPKQVATAAVVRVLTWKGWVGADGEVLVQILQPHPRLAAGQTVRATGMLQRPAPAMNPGQFDWADYYREQRVLASLQIPDAANIQILADPGPGLLEGARARTRHLLAAGFPAPRGLDHALLRALLLGDSDPELRDVQDDFKRTGTSHHLAISGLHIAVLGGFVYWLCRLLALSPRVAVVVMTGFVLSYGAVALPSPPVVRSVLLCLTVGVGMVFRRSIDFVQLLALSGLGMLIYRPLDLYNAGFQLSFGTVLGLILFTDPAVRWMTGPVDPDKRVARSLAPPTWLGAVRERTDRGLVTTLAAGFVAWCVSFPMIAYHFEQLNVWAILAGIVLAPVVFAALLGGMLKVVLTLLWPDLAGTWAAGAVQPVVLMRRTVDWLATFPRSDVPVPPPGIWLLLLFYALLLLALRPCPRPGVRWCLRGARFASALAILWLPLELGATAHPTGGSAVFRGDETRVTLLAVGAGQCAVVEPPSGRTLLIDAGSSSLSDLLYKCLGPYLRHRRHTSVDTVIVSHADYDHFGAVAEAAAAYGVREVLVGSHFIADAAAKPAAEAMLRALDDLQRPPRALAPGDVIPLGRETSLEVLWPPRERRRGLIDNDTSLVLRLTHAGRSVLFPGDIQDGAMRELLREPGRLKSDVLVAPHHGSREALTAAFVRAVNPSSIVSSNDRSLTTKQRTFESPDVLGGRPLYRTNRCGAITVRLARDGAVTVETFLPARR
jgi:competence protein ComEC